MVFAYYQLLSKNPVLRKELKEAVEKVNTMSEDEYMQRIADLREKAILDENSLKNEGKRDFNRNNYRNNRINKRRNFSNKLMSMKILYKFLRNL